MAAKEVVSVFSMFCRTRKGGTPPQVGSLLEEEEKLILAFLQGDPEAGNRIVDLYWRRVYRFVLRLAANATDAQDITQETFLRAFSNMGRLQRIGPYPPLKTWLFRIATNLFLDQKKRSCRKREEPQPFQAVLSLDREPGPSEAVVQKELVEACWKELRELSAEKQAVFLLRILEGLDYESIAKIVGKDVASVRWHMFDVRKKLQEKLSSRFEMEAQ